MNQLTRIFWLALGTLLGTATAWGQSPLPLQTHSNIPYVDAGDAPADSLQMLNLVVPEGVKGCPLLVWIGGGAWSYVNRHMEMDFAGRMGAEGIAVASVGHRLSPAVWRDSTMDTGVEHPAHVQDIAAAVKWLHDHAGEYGWDAEQIFIGGFSSGAHLAALVALDSSYLHAHQLSPSVFRGVLAISGAYDIPQYHSVFLNGSRPELAELHVEAVFGSGEAQLRAASPTTYIDQIATPMLLMADRNIYNYTRILEDSIRETGFTDVQVVYSHDLRHGELWQNLSHEDESFYRDAMLYFIRTHSASIPPSPAQADMDR